MLKTTPLNAVHRALGARLVDFAGWEMPVQYRGVIEEHTAVRGAAGLFDVSHMGEIEVKGPGALAFIQEIAVNDAARLQNGQVQYTAMCYPHGGTVDDMTLYRFDAEHYLFCVNAANTDKDFAWVEEVLEEGDFPEVTVRNASDDYAQLALQGPAADAILGRLTDTDLAAIPFYHFTAGLVAEVPATISRTGYTGERGFEIYLAPSAAERVWKALLAAGEADGLTPVGLGARDTLRLEAGLALYGHELSPEISPLEAGLGWITRLEKESFIGREALLAQQASGLSRRLAGLQMVEAGIPRAGYPVFAGDQQVGEVTSGTMSPSLRVGIALALVQPDYTRPGTPLQVGVRSRRPAAEVVKRPFLKK
jgi:aminomethyltransferase